MRRTFVVAAVLAVSLAAWPAAASGHVIKHFGPGAPGIGDPYYPLAGNGGYDARHYDLDVAYDPATDVLKGVAVIRARATQNLSRFNLDFVGLTIRSLKVDGRSASWSRDGGELTVTPKHGLRKHERFTVVVVYDGVPELVGNQSLGFSGFIPTDDGTFVAGQPEVAATWYPVNDHPLDKASYTFHITIPKGLVAMANGELRSKRTRHGRTTWNWDAREPMASYLTTATIGEFNLRSYKRDGIRYWDAIDPDLYANVAPRTGDRYAFSQQASFTYKRLARTIDVPAGGAQLSFWVDRQTELDWDYMFVEAHVPGSDEWTTLPVPGHTTQETGNSCPVGWQAIHPFLAHYQTDNGDGTCTSTGTTGAWNAATGSSDGYEQWTVDLGDYANGPVEVSISYASDDTVQARGVFVDDVVVSTGEGSTSFEDDGDTLDGWTVAGAPEGSPGNENDWITGTVDIAPATRGEHAEAALDRQPEIIAFEESLYGRYPWSASGGIIDDVEGLGFALETQTRPIYAPDFFDNQEDSDSVVVHELAHQWVGDSLAVAAWQHIWLNEGFATYTEWLWSEREGLGTAQEIFDFYAAVIPADDPFWQVVIGDPGTDLLFDISIYYRGAMTLHALRQKIGDDDFFRLLRKWVRRNAGGNVSTPQFIKLAEKVSGQDLDDFFQTWLFTPAKPAGIEPQGAAKRRASRVNVQSLIRKAVKR
jgi:hypothetical protein